MQILIPMISGTWTVCFQRKSIAPSYLKLNAYGNRIDVQIECQATRSGQSRSWPSWLELARIFQYQCSGDTFIPGNAKPQAPHVYLRARIYECGWHGKRFISPPAFEYKVFSSSDAQSNQLGHVKELDGHKDRSTWGSFGSVNLYVFLFFLQYPSHLFLWTFFQHRTNKWIWHKWVFPPGQNTHMQKKSRYLRWDSCPISILSFIDHFIVAWDVSRDPLFTGKCVRALYDGPFAH
jgi:hypothetical protein